MSAVRIDHDRVASQQSNVPSIEQLTGLLQLPSALGGRVGYLDDTVADPGLFGPESVTWKVVREPLLILGGGRALLMQAAHPLVAEGALDHSRFQVDPFDRLWETARWTGTVSLGTTHEATEAIRRINLVHRRVRGELSAAHATPRLPAGTPYAADDPVLARWVHATFVDTTLVVHRALVGSLTADDEDRLVREWNAVGRRLGVRERDLWWSRAELRAYIREQISSGPVMVGAGSREVARTILESPVDNRLGRAAWPTVTFLSRGLLVPALRSQYGISWTRKDRMALASLLWSARRARRIAPASLRRSATSSFALQRARGELAAEAGMTLAG